MVATGYTMGRKRIISDPNPQVETVHIICQNPRAKLRLVAA
jgi:hypothetical protein